VKRKTANKKVNKIDFNTKWEFPLRKNNALKLASASIEHDTLTETCACNSRITRIIFLLFLP
jgi:hypothetical protein